MKAAGASAETEGLPVSVFVDRMVVSAQWGSPRARGPFPALTHP